MKIRFVIVTSVAAFALGPVASRANKAPDQPPLPNIDLRRTAGPALAPALATPSSVQQATATLQSRVPGIKISRDPIVGSPRFVSAPRGFLSGPAGKGIALSATAVDAFPAEDPHRVIKAFLNEHSGLFGFDARALAAARVNRNYVTAHNGLRTVVWQQEIDGIPVFDALLSAHVTRNGELVNISSLFLSNPSLAADTGTPNRAQLVSAPAVSAAQSIVRAAASLGVSLELPSPVDPSAPAETDKHQRFSGPLLRGTADTRLVWLPMSGTSMRLCWQVLVSVTARPELYSVLVDAETGAVQIRRCLTNYATAAATYRVYTQESPAPMLPGLNSPGVAQAPEVPRELVTLVALSTNASPLGWIPDTGVDTRGNNVDAHTDVNADDRPDLPRPTATNRVFDFPLDLTKQPANYADAAVVQLFYWCNWYHDRLYEMGFTEAAGNFQTTNFNRGGLGNDAVQADAQDGSGVDNANFSTPPDGEPGRMQMYIFVDASPNRDGDLDGTVVLHEHTHGLSNRLVGGGAGIFLLQTEGMGEGWSDFYAMSLLTPEEADPHAVYPAGGYITYLLGGLRQNYYYGIRRYPYTTDLAKNPLTFKDIDPTQASAHPGIPTSPIFGGAPADEVHDQGEVWCVTLWEARANLIDKLGGVEGNDAILQTVTDGMKLSPVNPTFLEARDAILMADQVNSGGDNYSELWLAFAKRGMGVSATAPTSDTTVGVGEAFDVPPDVVPSIPDGIMEVTVNPRSGSAVFASDSQPIFVRVSDGSSVTNATIAAVVSGGSSLTFRNDGQAPDKTANNGTYSANFNVPTTGNSVTITLVITAPGKANSTNILNYTIIPLPANDNFANATKVPATGATYLSNNRFATMETGEPAHGGAAKASASLWWSWSTATTTNVLVDTGGSLVDTVLGVYTGTQVDALTSVASVDNIGSRKTAFATFNAQAGVAYKIAVASVNTNSTGTLTVRIVPGGSPDTSPPVVAITGPPSGITTSTNRVLLSGTAVDPEPNPTGIDRITIRITASADPSRVSEVTFSPGQVDNGINSTNWYQLIGLSPGLNTVRVNAIDFAGNQSSPAFTQVNYLPRDPINDLFANAIPLTNNSGISSINTLNAAKEFGEPLHAGNAGGKSAWWSFTPPADGVLTLSTTNSAFDSLLAVYLGSRVDSLTLVASNDDAYQDSGFSKISQAVRANVKYQIAVDGFDGASGLVYLNYSFASSNVFHVTVNTVESGSVNPGSGDYVSGSALLLTATPNPGYEFVDWEGAVASSANPLSVLVTGDLSVTARFRARSVTDGFESGGLTALPWSTSGVPWLVQNADVSSGSYAARSGVITNNQTSRLSLTVNSPGGVASFDYKVSSETNFDTLQFYLNGSLVQTWSGEADWATFQFVLPSGTDTLEWRYTKDAFASSGQDAAFIDNVDLPQVLTSLLLLSSSGASFQIQYQGPDNQTVRVQTSSDLASWDTVYTTNGVSNGAAFNYSDPDGTTRSQRFYRAVSP